MERLVVKLTHTQCVSLAKFFTKHHDILHIEHYKHTHSPLDDLGHYMWEELQEIYHKDLKKKYKKNGKLSDKDLKEWEEQEIEETRRIVKFKFLSAGI